MITSRNLFLCPLLSGGVLFLANAPVSRAAEDGTAFFESKIRPVLSENCYQCHSASALSQGKLKGGLQLDSREGIRKGGDTGAAVVPSNVDESLILRALRHEGDLKMPPKKKMGAAFIADIEKWITMGAPDPREGSPSGSKPADVDIEAGRKHWAFQPLSGPVPPTTSDASWERAPVDRFIRAAQDSRGVEPNPVADSRVLVRRAFFDLTGLPPSPRDVAEFTAAATLDFNAAWAGLIDRLLASEHYGERWGRHWLDLVRFAESNGYAFDKDRPNAWRYRDWVIRAFNADMPYDEFVREQLAGDLFAGSNWDTQDKAARALDLVTATGFIVGGPFTTQQTQKERERSRYEQLDDMIHTMGTSMLGLTVGCARCHDHKYDPIGTRDYYEWAAMFADVGFADIGVDLQPNIYQEAKAAFDGAHRPLVLAREAREKELLPGLDPFLDDQAKPAVPVVAGPWQVIGPFAAGDFNAAFDGSFGPETGLNLDLNASHKDGANKESRTWQARPDWKDGQVYNDVLKGANSAFYLQREIGSPKAQSLGLSVSGNDGLKVWVNGFKVGEEKGGGDAKADELKLSLPLAAGRNVLLIKIANGGGDAGFYFQTLLETDRVPKTVEPVMKTPRNQWNAGQRAVAFDWFKTHDLPWTALHTAVVRHEQEAPKPDLTLTYAAKSKGTSYQFGDNTYKVFHLHRGNADNKKEEARAGFLRVLSHDRAARWLGEEDPLIDPRWTALHPGTAKGRLTKLQIEANGQVTASGAPAERDTYLLELEPPAAPARITAIRLAVPASQASNFVLSRISARWVPGAGEPRPLEIEKAVASFVQAGFNPADVLATTPDPAKGWAISGGVGQHQELDLIFKTPQELTGGRLQIELAMESHWAQHLLTHFSISVTSAPDVREWAGKARPGMPAGQVKTAPREALAGWITDVDAGAGPLLARVIVNRLWQHHFGKGLVTTPSDFGTRGERPTHPELLDWLARKLIEGGWQLKPVHRLIMTSAVYLQGGGPTPGGLSRDPENLLYWRQPARRLEAEAIRDNLLAVSGRLDAKAFGPGTLDANSSRRSIYLTVKRGQLIEMLQLFDAPDAMQSIGHREVSTVAPQSLALLNSPAVRNWAADLAKRARPDAGIPLPEAVETACLITCARSPEAAEQAGILSFIERQTRARAGNAEAAFQDFCQLLLCSNEFVYID